MHDVKCEDCTEYFNEWCDKVIDSPHPNILRDCQYYHEKDRDLVKVIRCKDCKHYNAGFECLIEGYGIERDEDWYCGDAERREDV